MYNIHVSVQLVFTLSIHIHIKITMIVSHINNSFPPTLHHEGWPMCCLISWWHLVCLSMPSTYPFHSEMVLSCVLTLSILPPSLFFRSSFSPLPVFLDFETGYHVAQSGCLQTHYIAEDVFELIIFLLSTLKFFPLTLFLWLFVCFSEHFPLESWSFSILWRLILIVSLIQPKVTQKKKTLWKYCGGGHLWIMLSEREAHPEHRWQRFLG